MGEFIAEIIITVIAQYPGAAIRYLIFRKKPFKKYLLDEVGWNLLAVVSTFLVVFLIIRVVL